MHFNKIALYPLKVSLAFIIMTELLFFFGPINYDITNYFSVILFLLVVNVAFFLGYTKGVRTFKSTIKRECKKKTLTVLMLISFVLIGVKINLYIESSVGVVAFFEKVWEGIIAPSKVYFEKANQETTNTTLLLIWWLFSPIFVAAISIGVYQWKELTKLQKYIFTSLIFLEICLWIAIGTRKGLFDLLLTIVVIYVAKNITNIINTNQKRKYIVIFIGISSLLLFYFIFSNLSRYGKSEIEDLAEVMNSEIKPFYHNNFPLSVTMGLTTVTSYLCQGYFALSKALSLGLFKITPMGSSWFTIVLARIFGHDVLSNTYMGLLELQYGIDVGQNWHTIYTWLANDVTFIGVPIVIFFIGFFFSRTWCDMLIGNDILAVPLCPLFAQMIFYFFANNNVISFSFIPFWFFFYLYIIKKRILLI